MSLPTINRPFMRKWVGWTGKHFSRRVDQKLDCSLNPPAPPIQANLTSLLLTKSPSLCVNWYSENIQPDHIPNKWILVQTLRGILSQLCRLFLPEVAWTILSAKYEFTKKSKPTQVYRSACHACPSWRRRSGLHNPNICHQPRWPPPALPPRTIYYFSSGELARKVILPEFEFYAKLCLFKTCIVIRSTSSGTKSRISDSHWLHNQVFAIKHTIHLNRIFLPFIGWLSPQLQHWYLIAASIV